MVKEKTDPTTATQKYETAANSYYSLGNWETIQNLNLISRAIATLSNSVSPTQLRWESFRKFILLSIKSLPILRKNKLGSVTFI